jgi:hypothetical protein
MLNRVYSFGQSNYKKTKASDGTERKIINEILFNKINYNNKTIILGHLRKGLVWMRRFFTLLVVVRKLRKFSNHLMQNPMERRWWSKEYC